MRIRKAIEYFFAFVCIAATIATTCWCAYIFYEDHDVSLVDFKQYNEEKEYIYPSYSLVFWNPFKEEKLKSYGDGINTSTYSQFLEGTYWDERMLNISYDDVTIDIGDYFLGYDIWFFNGTFTSITDFEHGSIDGWEPPRVSFRQARWKAFAVQQPYRKGQMVAGLSIKIRTNIFRDGIRPHKTNYDPSSSTFGGFEFAVHYPGQMFRSTILGLGKWEWPKRTNSSSKTFEMSFTRKGMEVLLRRNKRAKPCNEDWLNYDSSVLKGIMRDVGCRPPYYDFSDLPLCSTMNTMKRVASLTFEDLNNFAPPCRAISTIQFDYEELDEDDATTGTIIQPSFFRLSITTLDTTFKLIQLVKSYDIQSLIGNAGGYLGIFLGYAIYQMPGAIMNVWDRLMKS